MRRKLLAIRTTRSVGRDHGHSVDGEISGIKIGLSVAGNPEEKGIIRSDSKDLLQMGCEIPK